MKNKLSPGLASLLRPWYRAAGAISYGVRLPYYRTLDRYRLNDLDSIYTEEYFEKRNEPPYDHGAKTAVEVMTDRYSPSSVFDVGCAVGVYLKYFEEKNINVAGHEGAKTAVDRALVDSIEQRDLRDALHIDEQYDLVSCIEVAEHLHPIHADGLIETIVSGTHNNSHIVFTAAPPGQYGTHHVNLQYPQYWIDKFATHGWEYQELESTALAAEIRERSETPLVMTNNLMVFTSENM